MGAGGFQITKILFLFVALTAFTQIAIASRVDNFVLLDHTGAAHELYYQSDADAVVIMAQANDCPSMTATVTAYEALKQAYTNATCVFS